MKRLAEFIATHREEIIAEWVVFARSIQPSTAQMCDAELRDHCEQLLKDIVEDMDSPQSAGEQTQKSIGHGAEGAMAVVGRQHASQRMASGFQLDQVVSEFRALRASVLRLWSKHQGEEAIAIVRFNEAIDESLTESVKRYSETVDRTREQFLGMLGHDLRNPLGAIVMSARVLTQTEDLSDKALRMATRIANSADRMNRMVDDLLDLTRTRLGSGIPIARKAVDLSAVCRQVIAEIEAFHPDASLQFKATGDLQGEWDGDRLAQVISNLVANAVQYGSTNGPIRVMADDHGSEVEVRVHNAGPPIPPGALASIFESMVRVPGAAHKHASGLGLGLYIAREIVTAHGGTLGVISTAADGTTFTIHLPRHPQPTSQPSGSKTAPS